MVEELRKIRVELLNRVEELERRVERLEEYLTKVSSIELNWRISMVMASAQRLAEAAERSNLVFFEFEEDLRKFLLQLKKLVEDLRYASLPVEWRLLHETTSIMLSTIRKAGLPFRTVANLSVEIFGDEAENLFDEEEVKKLYGLSELELWKKRFKP
ncbi:MAG: hypothetical protein J7J94_02360 [Thaumarchaeota archaeon]|nr:hypothetical protein [Nitrososphaerota archaeon]